MRLERALEDIDLYAVLGVPAHATPELIRRRYRRLASISHPDLNPNDMRRAEQRMSQINVAAGILLDHNKRAIYDRMRRARLGGPARRGFARRRPTTVPPPSPPIDVSHVRLDARDLEWIERLRSAPARWMASFEAWTDGWSPEFRMMFLFASMAIAFGLIHLAKPTSLPSPFEEAKPTAHASVPASPT